MIFRPSGGVLYHWRAWRRRKAWRPFTEAVATWLESWQTGDELVLIGPSGGYTLPTAWLKRFKKITAYDLDPLAPLFFRRRHLGVAVEFRRQDVFWRPAGKNARRSRTATHLSTIPLREILDRHPQAAILYSNILGQLLIEGRAISPPPDERAWLSFLKDFRQTLGSRNWASYHDLYTHEGGEVIDHLLAGDWKQGLATTDFRWQLTPKSLHLIQGVRQA